MTETKEAIDAVMETLLKGGIKPPKKEVTAFVNQYVTDFHVPVRDIEPIAVREFYKRAGIKMEANRSNQHMNIGQIAAANNWIDITGKVAVIWDNTSDAMLQTGLIGDSTGVTKFTIWKKSGLQPLEKGLSYDIKGAVTKEYNGMFSVDLVRTTKVTVAASPVDIIQKAATVFTGMLVDVQRGSGLIKRCPICKRSLVKGICSEHSKVEGTYDMRIKGVLDTGHETRNILLQRALTEQLTGISLQKAQEIAMAELDSDAVAAVMKEMLVGKYYTVTGNDMGDNLLVETMLPMEPITIDDVQALITELEG